MVSYAELRDLAVLKLKELERQREKLEKSYSATLESADAASNPREKLKALYRGIQATTFADSPLHPDVDNLENLLAILEATSANGNSSTLGRHQGVVVQGWIEKLILEINRGKTRTKYAWLFGKILEEWFEAYGSGQISAARSLDDDDEEDDDYVRVRSSQPNAPARPTSNPEREQFFKKLSGLSTAVPESDYDISVIDDVLKGKEEWIAPVRKTVREYAKKGISKKVTANEVRAAVDSICRDNLVDQTAKQQLRDLVSGSDMLVNEYVGVLTVMLNNVDEWDWPAGSGESATANKSDALKQGEKKEPPTMRVRRNRSYKYRAFIDEDILTAVFLQIVGVRWSVKLKAHLLSFMSNYENRVLGDAYKLAKKIRGAPEPQHDGGFQSSWQSMLKKRQAAHQNIFCCSLPDTAETQSTSSAYGGGGHSAEGGAPAHPTKKQQCLNIITAEVQLAKNVDVDGSVTVVGIDIENFYPSLPHSLLIKVLETFGFPKVWISFFHRYLTPIVHLDPSQYADASKAKPIGRGILLAHALSRMLSEMLLFLMDIHVLEQSRGAIKLMRVVDDIFFLHTEQKLVVSAYNNLISFLKRCGLRPNAKKSGSVVIPCYEVTDGSKTVAPKPAGDIRGPKPLPQNPVCWGLLELCSTGFWEVKKDAFATILTSMRNDLVGSPWQPNQSMPLTAYPILTFINIYNSYNRYLMKMLSAYPTSYALGARHIKNVVLPALIEVQDTVVEGGVVAYLQRVIKERFEFRAGDGNDEEQLAEAWFYWPITAGGLAITHPLITLNAISEGIKRESLTRVIRFEDMKRDPFGRARAVRDGVVYYGSEVTSRTAKKDNNNQDDQDNEEGGDEDADVAVEESSDDEDENKVEDEDDDDEEDYDDDNDVDVYQESDDEETIARAQANRDKEEQWWFVVDPDTLKPLRENESSAGTSPSTPQKEPMLLWVPRKWETETANYWGSQYSTLTDTADPMQPKKTGQLELLIEEFVDRGSDVRGSSSKKSAPITKSSWGRLGNYWKWIICTYSEQVLQMFGSLGLTSAQLIPLALISEIRKQSTMDL